MTRRLHRTHRRVGRVGPPEAVVAAARKRLAAEAAALARGEPVDHDTRAAAIVRADARSRGIDLDDPDTAARLRAELVDDIANHPDR